MLPCWAQFGVNDCVNVFIEVSVNLEKKGTPSVRHAKLCFTCLLIVVQSGMQSGVYPVYLCECLDRREQALVSMSRDPTSPAAMFASNARGEVSLGYAVFT